MAVPVVFALGLVLQTHTAQPGTCAPWCAGDLYGLVGDVKNNVPGLSATVGAKRYSAVLQIAATARPYRRVSDLPHAVAHARDSEISAIASGQAGNDTRAVSHFST